MAERIPCEFFLIRYVPDVVKGEFTNIGVVLREAVREAGTASASSATAVRFTRDWARVRCMDADADTALLEALEGEIAERLRLGAADTKPVMQLLEDTLSNSLQISEPRAALAESMAVEMEQLMRMYVEPMKVKQVRQRTGRAAIQATMRTEFERAAVWSMMRKRIAASTYTRTGDPMRLDCGYRALISGSNGTSEHSGTSTTSGLIRIFQAVSLEGDVDGAKGLAWAAPQLREGVRRVESAELELTAVVEPVREVTDDNEAADRYRFGVEAMEREAIRVVTLNDLARVAETARMELGI